ncbi:DEAD/DEAH box helicase [Gaiella sp.]|uniref:DEAD/DEAH box helicase n=1 Tax=Gaiella sp. TaxID=2663207 RepID=UPI002E360FF3|nr:DEAD/DEAH box helicase [Gaiella sp.]HEX5585603.1 DEAD/DEAH box helicase [Gaiella sp.]
MSQETFAALGVSAELTTALELRGITAPFQIQTRAIPPALAGTDLLAKSPTGSGKTLAFAVPLVQQLPLDDARPAALVLVPTRELALQVTEEIDALARARGAKVATVYGGVTIRPQANAARTADIVVATPGRLQDLLDRRLLTLDAVAFLVLDEADRMLDMGFVHDIKRVVAMLPKERQTLFFSATMPQEITRLADSMLRDPARVSVTPQASTAEKIAQRVILTEKASKGALLAEVLKSETIDRVLVFTRTKHGADKVVRVLAQAGLAAEAIHGNKSQNQRERVLAAFRKGSVRTLVATDIAARGIDVDGISHVVNYDLPNIPESYVHRIGRTARAGAEGVAISFCDHEERAYLRDIEKLIRMQIPATDRRTGQRPAQRPAPHQQVAAKRHNGHPQSRAHHPAGRLNNGNAQHGGRPQPHHQQRRKSEANGIGNVTFLQRPGAPR